MEATQAPAWSGVGKPAKEYYEDYERRIADWTFLKRGDLAWRMLIMLDDEGGVMSLTRSRTSLYLWSLILIVGSLLLGIGYTVRAVIREARLSTLKTDFVSSVSHDLRTPLTSIRMFTETLLLGRASSRDEEREFLQVIADETERLSRLTERILDFSRMEAGRKAYHFGPQEIREVVHHALAACRPMIEEGKFEVITEIDPDLPPIQADRDAMIEVLINLVSNAIKYSPDERLLIIRANAEGDRASISVVDRGIGIARHEHRRIFEKFYRVECRRTCEVGGSGIGLSLVEHIVNAHHGDVVVDSKPGAGSTFTVRLPIVREAFPEESRRAALEVG
jgi:signal transduction histidine kinase